jgi:chaperonin cofactor prefoldin
MLVTMSNATETKVADTHRTALGVGTPLQRNERESLILALEDQVDDLKTRLDRSERDRRADADTFRAERERMLAMIERLAAGTAQ